MRFTRSSVALGAALFAALLAVLPGSAQAQQGAVAGLVADKSTGQALAGAVVTVSPSNRGAVTDQNGHYRIENVSPGPVEIRVRFIGYSIGVLTVMVAAGETATADFGLTPNPIGLEAVVVTATGAEQRVRELGNTVATINAAKATEIAPITNMADLLNGRAPGVQVITSGGTTGSGTRIRIRGASSLSLTNEPIVVVDGIRVDNEAISSSIGVGGQSPSRLNDLNPDEIESIEVVKGPSAAALYGTNAANGVIQIRTKQGRPGPTQWAGYVEGGVLNDVGAWPANWTSRTATGGSCSLTGQAGGACVIDTVRSFNPIETFSPFRQGVRQKLGMSAAGGSEQTTFYLAGDFERERGVFQSNDLKRVNLRANLHNQVSQLMDISVSTGYTSSDLVLPQNDNNDQGILPSGLLGLTDSTNHGYRFLTPQEANRIFTGQSIERFTGSVNLNFRPWTFLTVRGVVGTDVTNRSDNETTPPNTIPLDQDRLDGNHVTARTQVFSYTGNLSTTASFRVSSDIITNTSVGLQYLKTILQEVDASGRKLVGGTNSLGGVVIPTVGENTEQSVTLGGYIEEQVGIRDRLFLTAALRGDDNSAFGQNFNFITYPKVSASWVISQEPFFPRLSFLNSLRLRAAYGRSGRQPGPNDALQFFTPVAVAANGTDVPGITIGSLGNADLRPEKTREVEMGLDADVWKQRVHFEFTYYDKNSKDALIARKLAPSLGASDSRFENLGEVSNKGVELLLTAQILSRPNLGWSVTASAWGNRNRLIHLGQGITPIIFGLGGATQRHEEGYPLGGYWDYSYTYSDANNDGLIAPSEIIVASEQSFQGSTAPTRGGTVSTEVNFMRHFRVYGLLDGRWGNKLDNSTEEFRCLFGICRGRRDPKASLAEQARAVATVFDGLETGYFEDAGFVKLREVSLTYFAPAQWARRIGASALSFTLSGRNLATWTNYTGVDPELNNSGQTNFSTADFLTQPPVRYFVGRVNVSF